MGRLEIASDVCNVEVDPQIFQLGNVQEFDGSVRQSSVMQEFSKHGDPRKMVITTVSSAWEQGSQEIVSIALGEGCATLNYNMSLCMCSIYDGRHS